MLTECRRTLTVLSPDIAKASLAGVDSFPVGSRAIEVFFMEIIHAENPHLGKSADAPHVAGRAAVENQTSLKIGQKIVPQSLIKQDRTGPVDQPTVPLQGED